MTVREKLRIDVASTLETLTMGDGTDTTPINPNSLTWTRLGYPHFGQNTPDDILKWIKELSELELDRLFAALVSEGFMDNKNSQNESNDRNR